MAGKPNPRPKPTTIVKHVPRPTIKGAVSQAKAHVAQANKAR
jgi:hypothetical protein